MSTYRTDPAVPGATPPAGAISRVSWGAIFAGAVLASALMVFFSTLGIGIGASVVDPAGDSPSPTTFGVLGGIYTVVTQVISLAAGGWAAARLAGVPRMITSVLHGASVWAASTLFLAFLAISGGSAVISGASSVIGGAASGVSSAVQAAVPDDLSVPSLDQITQNLSFEDLPPELRETLEEADVTPQTFDREAREAFRSVISQDQQQAAREEATSALQDVIASPADAGADIQSALDDILGGPNAVFNQEDREEALGVLERRLGIGPQEAEQVVATVERQAEEAVAQVRETAQTARTQAVEAAQAATRATANVALLLSLASLLGLAAAAGGAYVGRPDDIVGDSVHDHA